MREWIRNPLIWIFAAYCALTAATRSWHEPWRDETDAWLIARDGTVSEIFHIAPNGGTPSLWYFAQMPFAKAGLPVAFQGYLNLGFVWMAVWLLLFRSPFPWWVKSSVVASEFLLFEYSVVARNYGLGVLILFALASADATRLTRPWRYGLLTGLLAHVSAHFLFLSAAIALSFSLEAFRQKKNRPVGPSLLAWAGIVSCVLILWPRPGGQLPGALFPGFSADRLLLALKDLAYPTHEFQRIATDLPAVLGAALVLLVAGCLDRGGRAFRLLVLMLLGIGYVFGYKYYTAARHAGVLFVALVYCLWISAPAVKRALPKWEIRLRPAFGCLLLCCLASFSSASAMIRQENQFAFSGASELAGFLTDNKLAGRPLVGHLMPMTAPILAFLPKGTKFWYPGIQEWGSFLKWDVAYIWAYYVKDEDAVARVKKHFPNWNDSSSGPILVFNRPIANAETLGYELLFNTKSQIWAYGDERYYVYGAATAESDRKVASPRRTE